MQWQRDAFTIDDDRARLDRDLDHVVAWLRETYWASWCPADRLRRSWEEAGLVAGLYDGDDLIGCVRVLTDFARVAYLTDVYLAEAYRGRGLGRWLVGTILDHPDLTGVRWLLDTRDAHDFYRAFGFTETGPDTMTRPRPSHDPERIRTGLRRFAGMISPEDAERIKETIYRGREEGTRPPDRPKAVRSIPTE